MVSIEVGTHYPCLTMTPSSTLATSSQRSVAASRKSSVSFHLMIAIGSRSSSNSRLSDFLMDAIGLVLEAVDFDGVRDEPLVLLERVEPLADLLGRRGDELRQLPRAEADGLEPVEPNHRR